MKQVVNVGLMIVLALTGDAVNRQSTIGSRQSTLDVYWIDVEGGGATLIVTPAGESVLIDTGYPDERGAPRIHKAATEMAGLKAIDHLVVTHFHIDHFGGAVPLSKLMPIGRVYDNGAPSPPPSEKDAPLLAEYVAAFEGKRHTLQPGESIPLKQPAGAAPLSLRLLGTREQFGAAPAAARPNDAICAQASDKPADASDNRNSTVWILRLGGFAFFDGGDLTWNTEKRLVCPANLPGQVDVYQVNHHGLDQSNNPVLVRSLAPTVAIMNNGPRKGTQPQAVATLKEAPSILARYQLHKNVREDSQNSTADEYIANVPEQCAANVMKMSVEPDGRRYTIGIPATGHSRRFETRSQR
jgi:beta-lactamase superfamily II metal-dependent hydrolase